jgi:hypothetical protein
MILLLALSLQAPRVLEEPRPRRPVRLHAEVDLHVVEVLEEERAIREYRQAQAAEDRAERRLGAGRFTRRMSLNSGCVAPQASPEGGFPLPPQDPWDPPPFDGLDPWNPPITIPGGTGGPGQPGVPAPLRSTVGGGTRIPGFGRLTLVGRVSGLQLSVSLDSGAVADVRSDPAVTGGAGGGGTQTNPPPPGGGGGSGGTPPAPTPTSTASATSTSSASASSSESAIAVDDEDRERPLLAGPELEWAFWEDLSRVRGLRWMPKGASLGLSLRALFGTMEVFDRTERAALYSLGPSLRVPLLAWGSFEVDGGLFSGGGYLDTGWGGAAGYSGSAGFTLSLGFGKGAVFVGSIQAEVFEGDGVSAWGPAFNLGVVLGW